MTETVTQPAAQVERDRWGRPMVIPPGGGKKKSYRRCTTFVDVLDDRWALEAWKQRQVAHGLALRHDLVLKAASAAGDKKTLNEVAEAAMEAAGSSSSATTGTALHAITEQLDRGESPLIPPSAQADVDAYTEAIGEFGIRDIEVFVVNDALEVGGTFDRILTLDGKAYVADIKTGSIDYSAGKIAMQLAVYSRSQRYNISTGKRTDLGVDLHRGLVIHLPAGAGECTLHWADLDAGWEGVKLAAEVWQWRKRQGLLEAPPPGPDLLALIAVADDRTSLEQLYRNHEPTWTAEHTAAAKRRLAQLDPSPAPAG